MLYLITYKRRSDRNPDKWTEFTETLSLSDLCNCLKWLEMVSSNHTLISVVPLEAPRTA